MNRLFCHNIRLHAAPVGGKKLLVAISGGCDSILLAHLLVRNHYDVVLAHANFQLRGEESQRDEDAVRAFASDANLPLEVKRFTIKDGGSIQEKARTIRYEWFGDLMRAHNCQYISTAHQADDNTETMLMQLIRGAGPAGLSGMKMLDGCLFRPMLPFSRIEIEKEAKKRGLKWVEDSSNQSNKYLRNKLRLEVIPELKAINPRLNETLERTMVLMREAQAMADILANPMIERVSKSQSRILVDDLTSCSFPLTVLFQWLEPIGFSAGEIREVLKLLKAPSGKKLASGGFTLLRNRNYLILTSEIKVPKEFIISGNEESFRYGLYEIKVTTFEQDGASPHQMVAISAESAPFPWTVRLWRKGDRIKPIGMKGSKKLSDLFIQNKIPIHEKNSIPVVESNGEIICVCGLCVSRNVIHEKESGHKQVFLSWKK